MSALEMSIIFGYFEWMERRPKDATCKFLLYRGVKSYIQSSVDCLSNLFIYYYGLYFLFDPLYQLGDIKIGCFQPHIASVT